MKKLLVLGGLLLATTASAHAQVAQGGTYQLERFVIASGSADSIEIRVSI